MVEHVYQLEQVHIVATVYQVILDKIVTQLLIHLLAVLQIQLFVKMVEFVTLMEKAMSVLVEMVTQDSTVK